MVVRSSTSLTFATSVAKISLPSLKVRYCRVSVISLTLMRLTPFSILKTGRGSACAEHDPRLHGQ